MGDVPHPNHLMDKFASGVIEPRDYPLLLPPPPWPPSVPPSVPKVERWPHPPGCVFVRHAHFAFDLYRRRNTYDTLHTFYRPAENATGKPGRYYDRHLSWTRSTRYFCSARTGAIHAVYRYRGCKGSCGKGPRNYFSPYEGDGTASWPPSWPASTRGY